MARKRKPEEHMNHEAWAIPYGDLVTLLLAFFVVMYAISSLNEGKYRVLSDSLFAAFRGAPRTMEPVQVGEKQVGSGADVKTTLVEQSMLEGQPRSLLAPVPVKTGMPNRPADTSVELTARQVATAKALRQVADEVERAMDDLVKAKMVVVRRRDFWIEVEIQTDILFPSASAQLQSSAISVIERLGVALARFPNPIRVEGHTDNVPIKTVAFSSNWELSAARAGTVVRVLASRGVSPERLAVIGYGEYRPTHPNTTPEGRNSNRRVVVVILSTDMTESGEPRSPIAGDSASPEDRALPPGMPIGDSASAPPAEAMPVSTDSAAPASTRDTSPLPAGALATPLALPRAEAVP